MLSNLIEACGTFTFTQSLSIPVLEAERLNPKQVVRAPFLPLAR